MEHIFSKYTKLPLIKTVKEYVWNKIKDDNISEAYFEWEGEKNETTE